MCGGYDNPSLPDEVYESKRVNFDDSPMFPKKPSKNNKN